MTLVVDFEDLAGAVKRHASAEKPAIYLKQFGDAVHLTFVEPSDGVQIVALFAGTLEEAKSEVLDRGFDVADGTWVTEASIEHIAQAAGEAYIASVAYNAKGGPGLWVDAFPVHPSEGTVLRAMFDEFVSEGLLDQRDYDVFLKEAQPTVRVLEPENVVKFLKQKQSGAT